MDFAASDDPAVQAQLDRLAALSVPRGRLSLNPIRTLLSRLGDPHLLLPPVFHVAGTNGKGSTCAFLRAALEASGHRVHLYTSPHLVRFNERIRLAGRLIEDAPLAGLLGEVLDAGEGIGASFFEVTTAAAFLAFARTPADACVVEVGLGGRLDATNVLPRPAVCGIASLGIDHEAFLLAPEPGAPEQPLARIAWEKAGIAKPGVPLVTLSYPPAAAQTVTALAEHMGARLSMAGRDWAWCGDAEGVRYRDARGEAGLPLPVLAGAHQAANLALAAAMLRHQQAVEVLVPAIAAGARIARWPARLQRLGPGPLTAQGGERTVWLDGGHNRDAGARLGEFFASRGPLHLIVGMLANKDPAAIVAPLASRLLSLTVVPVPGHASHPPEAFARALEQTPAVFSVADDCGQALAGLPHDVAEVLIAGSLYLGGEVLRRNGELPD